MKLVKFLLMGILGIALIVAGLYMLSQRLQAFQQSLQNFQPLAKLPFLPQPKFSLPQLPQMPKPPEVPPQVSGAVAQAGKMLPPLPGGNILGSKDGEEQPSEENKSKVPAHQFAFEKSRYEYCKGVVSDYEQRYMSTPKPEVSE